MFQIQKLRTRRYFRIAASSFYFMQGIVFASWASRIPDIKEALNLSTASLGAVLFAIPMGQLTAMAMSGYLVSKYGSKRMLTIGAIFYPLALWHVGTVTSLWHLAIGLYLFGISSNVCNISVNTQGIGVERVYGRSIMASFHGLWSLAGFTGGLISTLMVGLSISPFWHFGMVFGFALLVNLTMGPSLLPRDAVNTKKSKEKGPIFTMPDKFILTLGIIVFGSMICEGTMFDWSSIYFEEVIKPSKDLIRLGYIAFMGAMATGRFTADKLVTRFGVTRIIQVSGAVITTGLLIAVIFPHLITATLGFMLVGFGTSSIVPLSYGMAGKSKKMLPGIALATVSTLGFFGFLIGPPIIGMIAHASSMRVALTVIATIALINVFVSPRLNKFIDKKTDDVKPNHSSNLDIAEEQSA
jgi:MFS family permease